MIEPTASRPYMPGYGIEGPEAGSGLLPWSWAETQLVASRNFWLARRTAACDAGLGRLARRRALVQQ